MSISRRSLIFGLPMFVAGCSTGQYRTDVLNYAAVRDEAFPIDPLPLSQIKPDLRRREVEFDEGYSAGTIVVNTPERRLYYVLSNRRAIRYGIGVGREGLVLRGNAVIGRKAEWPSWRPTDNMIRREARYAKYAGGVPGGPRNPLGARALYLYRGGGDTMFRIHGTNQPHTIGGAVSSGCIRMTNHDVIDLYDRASVGARVVVIQA